MITPSSDVDPKGELKKPFWRRRWLWVLLAAVALVILSGGLGGVVYFQPRVAINGMARLNPDVLFQVSTTKKIVALTIDDGPHPEITPQVLDLLAESDVQVTFFVLGANIPGNEHLLERMQSDGHEIGNHLMEDRPSITLSDEEFVAELKAVDPWLDAQAPRRWLRPGSGWFTPEMVDMVQRHGYGLCLGSIFPHDDKVHDPEKLSGWVLDRVHPGAIIILHDGLDERASLPVTLDRVLTGLKERGYEVTTVSELVRRGN